MRLLVLTPVFPPAQGGIETTTREIVSRMPAGTAVHVATLDEPGAAAHDATVPWTITRVRNEPRGGRRATLRLNLHAVAIALRFRPTHVLCMHVREAPAAAAIAAVTGARWTQFFHAREIPTWRRCARLGARRANAAICHSAYTRQLIERVAGAQHRLHVIHPGIATPPQPARPAGEREPIVLTVARTADWYKGHDVMLEAMQLVRARIPSARWVVVGSGAKLPELEDRARCAGLDGCVEFLGRVDSATRDEWFARARVLALPSRVDAAGREGEGFGLVFIEAAAYGTPSVGPDEGGAAEAVVAGRTGLQVDPRDVPAVADALCRVLLDAECADALGAGAREWAQSHQWDRLMPDVHAVITGHRPEEGRTGHGSPVPTGTEVAG